MFGIDRYLLAAAAVLAAGWCAETSALARSSTVTRSFETPRGTVTQSLTRSYTPATGVATRSETTTGPQGRTASVSATSAPDGRGGFTDTRSVTNFQGQTRTSTRQIGR